MSVINSRLNKLAQQIIFKAIPAKNFCNAGSALQNVIRRLGPGVKNSLLLRCDELPVVQGEDENVETVFSEVEETGSYILEEARQVCIQFHTNITPCIEWIETSKQKITNVTALPVSVGTLTINSLKNSGCIISVYCPVNYSAVWKLPLLL